MRLDYDDYTDSEFSNLLGKTIVEIEFDKDNDTIKFVTDDGVAFVMHHEQSCCESVSIESITGDISDLLNSPITLAEESSNSDSENSEDDYSSSTWTFYKLATNKGYVDIRWYGSSNGYYSERVDFIMLK